MEGSKSWERQWNKPLRFGVLWMCAHSTEEVNARKEDIVAAHGFKFEDWRHLNQLKELISESEQMALYKNCKACFP